MTDGSHIGKCHVLASIFELSHVGCRVVTLSNIKDNCLIQFRVNLFYIDGFRFLLCCVANDMRTNRDFLDFSLTANTLRINDCHTPISRLVRFRWFHVARIQHFRISNTCLSRYGAHSTLVPKQCGMRLYEYANSLKWCPPFLFQPRFTRRLTFCKWKRKYETEIVKSTWYKYRIPFESHLIDWLFLAVCLWFLVAIEPK